MSDNTNFTTLKLDDSVIAHIVKLVQLGFLQGLDVVDYFRQMDLIQEDDSLFLEPNYEQKISDEIQHLLDVAETRARETTVNLENNEA